MDIKEIVEIKDLNERSKAFMKYVLNAVKAGKAKVVVQAKCVCVDARVAQKEEVGQKFTVWSHGTIEREDVINEDTVFITTLDDKGNPVVDEKGNKNTYLMPLAKFKKRYKLHTNGHYVQDPTPMATIALDPELIPENGIELLPPNWGGYSGTLMKGGLIMLPFDSSLSADQQVAAWEEYFNGQAVDWYPNNEPDTYAPCDRRGKFKDENLRKLYGQNKPDPEQAD